MLQNEMNQWGVAMRALTVIGLSAALICCAPETPQGARVANAEEACRAEAKAEWTTPSGPMRLHAAASGPTCGQSAASLVIRSEAGDALYASIYPVNTLYGFETASTAPAMQAALTAWIDPGGSPMRTTTDLPPWRPGAEQPESGEFPFFPSEQYAEPTAYEQLRTQALPIYCYPQGRESLSCLVLRDETLEPVGLQTFPG